MERNVKTILSRFSSEGENSCIQSLTVVHHVNPKTWHLHHTGSHLQTTPQSLCVTSLLLQLSERHTSCTKDRYCTHGMLLVLEVIVSLCLSMLLKLSPAWTPSLKASWKQYCLRVLCFCTGTWLNLWTSKSPLRKKKGLSSRKSQISKGHNRICTEIIRFLGHQMLKVRLWMIDLFTPYNKLWCLHVVRVELTWFSQCCTI